MSIRRPLWAELKAEGAFGSLIAFGQSVIDDDIFPILRFLQTHSTRKEQAQAIKSCCKGLVTCRLCRSCCSKREGTGQHGVCCGCKKHSHEDGHGAQARNHGSSHRDSSQKQSGAEERRDEALAETKQGVSHKGSGDFVSNDACTSDGAVAPIRSTGPEEPVEGLETPPASGTHNASGDDETKSDQQHSEGSSQEVKGQGDHEDDESQRPIINFEGMLQSNTILSSRFFILNLYALSLRASLHPYNR